MSHIHLCRFSFGLDDLTRKQQRDYVAVLRVLKRTGGFSAFEASANDTIATTMTRLLNKGLTIVRPDGRRVEYGRLLEVTGGAYPITKVRLTPAGEQLLKDARETDCEVEDASN